MNNTQLIRKQLDEIYNKGNIDALDQSCTDSLIVHDLGTTYTGRESAKQLLHTLRNAFPDMRMEVDQVIGEGDWVAAKWKASATHRGPFFGIAPTNKFETIDGLTYYHFKNHQITEMWTYWDLLKMLHAMNVELPLKVEQEIHA